MSGTKDTAPEFIVPDQPLATGVFVGTSTRLGGFSDAPWQSMNLGFNGGDDERAVQRNRDRLSQYMGMSAPVWLNQCHTTQVLSLPCSANGADNVSVPGATGNYVGAYDAAWTNQRERVLVVLTADCLPVVIASTDGSEVAVAHAGWRGLAGGIIENTVHQFQCDAQDLSVWLGPAIGPQCFEVGDDVRQAFISAVPVSCRDDVAATEAAFTPTGEPAKWMADLYTLARLRLTALGISSVAGGQHCTYSESERFYSYRRDGARSGRMGTFVYTQAPQK